MIITFLCLPRHRGAGSAYNSYSSYQIKGKGPSPWKTSREGGRKQ